MPDEGLKIKCSSFHAGGQVHVHVRVRVWGGDLLGQLLLCISAELQQPHEYCRHVHVRLPHSETSANQIDGGAADGAVRRQLGTGRLQQQESQSFTCKHRTKTQMENKYEEPGTVPS